jgi:hypothetical protein
MPKSISFRVSLILIALFFSISLWTLTNYNGDLDYYRQNFGGSLRNLPVSLLLFLPLSLGFSNSCIYIAFSLLMAIIFLRYINQWSLLVPHIFIASPFLLFPSKDGLFFLLLIFALSYRRTPIGLLTAFFSCLIRPFYSLPFLLLFMRILLPGRVRVSNKFVLPTIFIPFLVLIALFYLQFDHIQCLLMDYLLAPNSLFVAAKHATTTDWQFLSHYNPEVQGTFRSLAILFIRSIFPVWMTQVTNNYYYFLVALSSIATCLYLLLQTLLLPAFDGSRRRYFLLGSFDLLLLIIPSSVALVTNAGSTARYISTLPIAFYYLLDSRIARTTYN